MKQTAQFATVVEEIDLTSADHANGSGRVYVGTTGNVKVDAMYTGTATFIGVPAGTTLPVMVKKVYKVGTTADDLVMIYSRNKSC